MPTDPRDRKLAEADGVAGNTGAVLAVEAASASSDTGDFGKTPFSSSYQWQAGDSGGDFSWSYDLEAPPSAGGHDPEVSLSYSSGAVDGQTAGANVQPGWIGEGWDYTPGYIERSYRPCADDTANSPAYTNATGDQCWRLPNARLVWNGKSTELILGADGKWRAADDDAAKVDLLTGTSNGDDNGEYWRITTTDGTRFYFGRNEMFDWTTGGRVMNSTSTVPVFANHTGEPCYRTGGFSGSWCMQAWRWNLDYVVDRHDNSMAYFYTQDQAKTGRNGSATSLSVYERGGWLDRIEYGMRTHTEYANTTPPAKMVFGTAERCMSSCWSGAAWTSSPTTANWPDTPWDLHCSTAATSCSNNITPSFFITRRLDSVKTQIWSGSGTTYQDVDQWDLTHTFPSTGNGTSPVLWLDSIKHTGKANGGSLALPAVSFGGTRFHNRADYDPNGTMAAPMKYRITTVNTETGGQILVSYTGEDPQCQFGSPFPEPSANSDRCFPQYYKPQQAPAGWSWWHKYAVDKVTERDLVGGSPDVEHTYTYSTAGSNTPVLWAHDDGPATWSTLLAKRSWGDWRGYPTVTTTTGPSGGAKTQAKSLYFRGLKNDYVAGDTETRLSEITNSEGEVWQDHDYRVGLHETIEYATPGGQALERTIYSPASYLTGTRTLSRDWAIPTVQEARINREGRLRTRTWLPLTSTWRATSKLNTWDATYGVLTEVNDYGDTTTSADNICTRTSYTPNTTKYLVDFPSREETVGLHCETPPTYPTDAVEDTRYYYDGATTHGTAPTDGNVTRTEEVVKYDGTTPKWIMTSTAGYDSYGRITSEGDALDRITTTEYTHGANGLVTSVKETNPKLHVTITTMDPRLGEPVKVVDSNGKTTEASYDDLGQLRKVWLPGRATTETPNTEYLYTITAGAASTIETRTLGPNSNQISTFEIYDGHLRLRQTQVTAPDGKRTITDTAYDTRGLETKESVFYNSLSGPTGVLVSFADADVSNQHRYTHDGLERQASDELWSNDVFKWQTITRYDGDRTAVIPPTGGTTTQEIFDADDQVTERRLYATSDLAGAFDATTYSYDDAGNLTRITDPVGNHWDHTYDMLGRRITETDPDSGATAMTYDNAGQLLTSTDSRSKTLAYDYDTLGRQVGLYETSTTGTQLASWAYDTIANGQLTSSTRYDAGNSYTSAITGYDDHYRPLGTAVTVPLVEGALAGTYTNSATYKVDGSPATVTYPEAAGMAAETVTYTYGDTGYLTTMVGADTYLSGATYAYDGLLLQSALGAAGQRITLTNTYDTASRRLQKTEVYDEATGWEEKLTEKYTYDPAGNFTSINETSADVTVSNQCFQYDHLRRLTEAWTTSSSACQTTPDQTAVGGADSYWHTYGYDKTGNRTNMVRHAIEGDTTDAYTYPAAGAAQPHTVKRIDTSGPAGTGSVDYTYDTTGNTTTRPDSKGGTQALTWDTEGHLSKVTEGSTDTNYVYDAAGTRILRRESSGNAALFLGATEIRKDPTGALSATRYYGTTAARTDGTLTWLGTDHHGTGNIAIEASTREVIRRRLDAFGRDRANPTTWPGEKGFVNGTQDPTGMTHLGAREYDPAIGRFISTDPLIDETDPQQMHGYAYASNNPTTFVDPDGQAVIGDHYGKVRAYRKYTYKKRGSTYKRYNAGYKIRNYHKIVRKRPAGKRHTGRAPRTFIRECSRCEHSKAARNLSKYIKKKMPEAWKDAHQAADGALSGLGAAGAASSRAGRDLAKGSSRGGKNLSRLSRNPSLRTVSRWGRSPWIKGGGYMLMGAGFALSALGNFADGDQGATAVGKAFIETGLSVIFGLALGALGGLLCGPPCAVVGAVAGGAFGSWLGGKANGWIKNSGGWGRVDSWFSWD